MPRKPTFINSVRRSLQSTDVTTDVMRRMEQALDAARDLESDKGPVRRGLDRLLRSARRELRYAFIGPLHVLLIYVCNAAAVVLLFGLLALL